MHRIDHCQCCGGRSLDAYAAGVAPFITEYVLRGVAERSRLLVCRGCGFRFFETRYDDDEAALLYGGDSLRAALTTRGFEVVVCERATTSSGRVWLTIARAPATTRSRA